MGATVKTVITSSETSPSLGAARFGVLGLVGVEDIANRSADNSL